MLDFRDPSHGDSGDGGDSVGNDKPVVKFGRYVRSDLEAQETGRNAVEIARRGEERPSRFWPNRQELAAVQAINFHGLAQDKAPEV